MNEQFGEKVKAIFDSITVLQAKDSDLKRDNANINGDSPMGAMLQYGANTAKEYNLEYLIKPAIAELHRDGWIHIHDLDFYAWTTTCTQIELRKLFKDGFNTGHGHLRAPKSIGSYAALAAIAIQSNQNDQHGGQSVVDFDYAMADGVRYTYQKYLKEGYAICERLNDLKDKAWILDYAMEKTTRDTYQAMEGFIHNLNTMHSRAGAQVPFSSINYGTDTSWEGRLAIEQLLLATEAGLGHGETPIFPIQIFRVKEGINYNPDDPNYDLFKLAMKVSAKRLFPNFAFIDAPFNLQYYKPGHPETEVAYMGCRTRVMGNVYPLYAVINEPNSTMQRLIRKLNLLDVIDEQSGSGKLDLIIQLPYVIKTEARRQQAENRRKDIENQLSGSKYGIAYTDGTEHITQLNRSVNNNLMSQIEYLTSMLYSQLGITQSILDGTADEKTMLNYNNRTIEPIISAIVDEMKRKFLTKTARSQHQSISFFRDPFKLVPVNDIAEIADKFTRNEIMTSNEIRQVVGMKPSEDPRADELRNKNLSAPSGSDQQSEEMPIAEVDSVEGSASDLDDKISKQKSKK